MQTNGWRVDAHGRQAGFNHTGRSTQKGDGRSAVTLYTPGAPSEHKGRLAPYSSPPVVSSVVGGSLLLDSRKPRRDTKGDGCAGQRVSRPSVVAAETRQCAEVAKCGIALWHRPNGADEKDRRGAERPVRCRSGPEHHRCARILPG